MTKLTDKEINGILGMILGFGGMIIMCLSVTIIPFPLSLIGFLGLAFTLSGILMVE